MHVSRETRGCFLRDDNLVIELPSLPSGRFHAHIGGDSTKHNRADAAPSQLKVQFCPRKGTPLPLGNQNVTVLGKTGPEIAETLREASFWMRRVVDRGMQYVLRIGRPGDIDQHDRGLSGTKPFRECLAFTEELRSR